MNAGDTNVAIHAAKNVIWLYIHIFSRFFFTIRWIRILRMIFNHGYKHKLVVFEKLLLSIWSISKRRFRYKSSTKFSGKYKILLYTYLLLDVLLFAFSIHNLLHCGSTKKDAEYSLCYIFVHTAQSSDCLRQIFLRHEREN